MKIYHIERQIIRTICCS